MSLSARQIALDEEDEVLMKTALTLCAASASADLPCAGAEARRARLVQPDLPIGPPS